MVLNCVTARPITGSRTRNSRLIARPAGMECGYARKSIRYSTGVGRPATSFMPQRGHVPGTLERTSRSIGHTNSVACARSRIPAAEAQIHNRREMGGPTPLSSHYCPQPKLSI
jgi:hypothetical protein